MDQRIKEMEIEAKKLESQGDYVSAARIEFQIIQMLRDPSNV